MNVSEVGDQQQQLGADERADDDVDAEVEDALRVEAARPRADQRELQAEQIGRRQQHAVGVDGEPARPQTVLDACCRPSPSMSRIMMRRRP